MNFSDSTEPIEPTDIEFFKLAGLVPDASVSIQSGTFDLSKYPATVSLLACSSKHGHFSAASTTGFIFGQTKALRSTFYKTEKGSVSEFEDKITVSLEKPVRHIRYSAEEDKLLIALPDGELLVYLVDDIQANKDQVKPIYTYQLGKDILDLRPNPEALPNLAAVLFEDCHCIIIDITTGETQATLPSDNITAMCWSPKGKQIVCGKRDGGLQHFDVQGASKNALAIPEEMKAGHGEEQEDRYGTVSILIRLHTCLVVQDVLWIENHIFLVMYARPRHNLEEDDFINDGYIINRKPTKDSNEPVYTRLAEITPIFGTDGRGNHFYMEIIRDLGKEIKHLVILANAATAEISFVGETDDGTWSTWQVNDGLLNFPLSKETCMDTYPMGLALDFSADEKLPPIDAGDNDTSVEPVPVLYYLNDEGLLGAHHCYNTELARRGESYKSTPQAPTQTTSATTTATPSAFGSTGSSGGSFADLLSGKTSAHSSTSGGFGSFGSAAGGALPSFSNLGSAPKIPSSGFGGLSSFGNASNTTTPTASKPAFGSTTGFGAAAGTSTPTSSTTSFGGFGSSKASDANQKTSDKKEETEQKKTDTPAFGSTSSLGSGGFGALAKNTVPDAKSPAPAFGSTSSLGSGGFGALAKNTVPDAKSPTPAFGSTTSLGSGGFGALAKNTVFFL
ncbi:hypothetical protein A0J61_02399 [Choanephora cucurbitarum]|uniref:Nucleoporin Nup159/Nup146 N-terminal domain-containing protein n=1 Tax=Choanephora cucurbitarum TaxID=101091 RepID=A0A1C7NKQ1_9FUNG|nr:hypothetical protein A0J61_02399 [Choanephora cucurbitarum]